MLQCTSLRSVACFSDNLKASLKKWIYLQCRSKALSELQSCGVMVSVTNGASGIKWAVSFLATFGSHIRLVFRPGWTGQALAAAWGLFQIDGGECLCQTFGKGFLNKVQVCPVAGQEPALASGSCPCGQIFWGCVDGRHPKLPEMWCMRLVYWTM